MRSGILRSGRRARLLAGSALSIAAAILSAGSSAVAAQSAVRADDDKSATGEIVVTANKRLQSVIEIPFNVSAYGAEQLKATGANSLSDLSYQVPNFIIQDQGARYSASAVPIIRGLNASVPVPVGPVPGQSPVGFYIGDSPTPISFPIEDVQRVEVLRGPQGTLYGAGALGGAVRMVPEEPKIGAFEGRVGSSVGAVAHSGDPDYSAFALVNVPITGTLAIRGNFKFEHEAGFIDQFGTMKRQGDNYRNGAPILADAGDIANSSAVYFNRKDVNSDRSYSGRASLLWKPTSDFKLIAAYNYSKVTGNGGPVDNPTYQGGVSPFDPRIRFPATGRYQIVRDTLEPYRRTSQLGSLDMSYDAGFATLSSTSTFFETRGQDVQAGTGSLLSFAGLAPYYLGSPVNPRLVIPIYNFDRQHSYTEEVRIVSKPGNSFDYVLGAYLTRETRHLNQNIYCPGCSEQSAAANGGSELPIILGGTFVPTLADGTSYFSHDTQKYHEEAIFGELTYHITPAWQITGGGRYFWESLTQGISNEAVLFLSPASARSSSSVHDGIFKFNTSYEYQPSHRVYATISQGFRRGGSNSFPLEGFTAEPRALLRYVPDKTLNYEIGLKGRFANRTNYSVDAFYIDWSKPEISTQTPGNGWPVVVNARKASSKGFEAEVSGPLVVHDLSYVVGAAYANAKLTKAFCLPAGDGLGGVSSCTGSLAQTINAPSGTRLPGAPKVSASGTLNYLQHASAAWTIKYTVNADYRSSIVNGLPSETNTLHHVPGYVLANASITIDHGSWELLCYVHNIADRRIVFAGQLPGPFAEAFLGQLAYNNVINRPRDVGLQLSYKW